MQPVHQRQQLRNDALFGLARNLAAFGRDRIDLVDEDDRGRRLGGFLEHRTQPLLALAIGRTHDLGPVDREEVGVALARDGLCQPGLAGARRAVEQHALGRIDAQPAEQFGIAQRQFDHLAQLADGIAHAADVVIVDVGAAVARLLEFGAQFDFGVFVDKHDALGAGRYDRQADLGERESRRVEHALQLRRHVAAIDLLLPRGGDEIAGHQRAAEEVALQCLPRPVERQFALRWREHHALRGPRFGLAQFNVLARADLRIGALQPVEPDQLQTFVFGIRQHHARRGGPLADDLDDVALAYAQPDHDLAADPREAGAAFLAARTRHLDADGALVFEQGCACSGSGICHGRVRSFVGSMARVRKLSD